jgi:putative redox protein
MRLLLETETSLVLESGAEEGFAIEAQAEGLALSPFHLLAASLATCTFSVLHGWAANAGLETADLRLRVEWDFAEEPSRVGTLRLAIEWPSLPQKRRAAAARAAEACTVHATLRHPPEIEIRAT